MTACALGMIAAVLAEVIRAVHGVTAMARLPTRLRVSGLARAPAQVLAMHRVIAHLAASFKRAKNAMRAARLQCPATGTLPAKCARMGIRVGNMKLQPPRGLSKKSRKRHRWSAQAVVQAELPAPPAQQLTAAIRMQTMNVLGANHLNRVSIFRCLPSILRLDSAGHGRFNRRLVKHVQKI